MSTARQIVLGALLMAGLWVPWAALGLIVFTVVASLLLLNFWAMEGHARAEAQNQFLTNVAVIGGLRHADPRLRRCAHFVGTRGKAGACATGQSDPAPVIILLKHLLDFLPRTLKDRP